MSTWRPDGVTAVARSGLEAVVVVGFNGVCIVTRDVRKLRDFYAEVLRAQVDGPVSVLAPATQVEGQIEFARRLAPVGQSHRRFAAVLSAVV